MAKVRYSGAVKEIRGALGNMVFKMVRGRPYAAERPSPTMNPPSESQIAHRMTWREAAFYSRMALQDPDLREHYALAAKAQKLPLSAAPMADFLNAPTVEEINTSAYTGAIGDEIRVRAMDPYGVVTVRVAVHDDQGELLEEGPATLDDWYWVYEAQTAVAGGSTVTVAVEAIDHPGNIAEDSKEVTLP